MDRELFASFVSRYRSALLIVLGASSLLNLLVFSGSAYLMLVYDSVLPSRSIASLGGLFAIMILVYAFQYVFDSIRNLGMISIANSAYGDLAPAVNRAVTRQRLARGGGEGDGLQPLRDLDQIRTLLGGSGLTALFDLPWVAVFLGILFVLHWWLGLAALAGVAALAAIALLTNRMSQDGTRDLVRLGNIRTAARLSELRFAETAVAMGMEARLQAAAANWDRAYLARQTSLNTITAKMGGAGRVSRLLLQSVILTVGALLVIYGEASPGIIIASSVLSGRALAPVDQTIANWSALATARAGWARIAALLEANQEDPPRSVSLPTPSGELTLQDVWTTPPGSERTVVKGINLVLKPGQILALIGPSAAGKTSLIKVMLGIWPARRGTVRIDGATFDQWATGTLGRHFGYVPQTVELIEGTIGENIARFDPEASSDAIIAAAKAAALHETILAFPDGYETRVSTGGSELSAGQRQRIGLARALYGNPHLVVLDEANSNLDAEGDAALAVAVTEIRQRGGIVVLVTHRPSTLGPVTHVAVMQGGQITDFGERDAVLGRLAKTTPDLPRSRPTPVKASSA